MRLAGMLPCFNALFLCADILSDQSAGITLFLPSNDAINATLEKFGLDFAGLLKNQNLCTQIVQYHILPSPIEVSRPCEACQSVRAGTVCCAGRHLSLQWCSKALLAQDLVCQDLRRAKEVSACDRWPGLPLHEGRSTSDAVRR